MELTVEKTGLLSGKKHLFAFERWSGTLQFTPGKPQEAVVNLSIQANSCFTKIPAQVGFCRL